MLLTAAELADDATLPLLGRLVHHFGARDSTLTTRGESPAGAGIAGSSALNIAVCGALARWTGQRAGPPSAAPDRDERRGADIHVPTGVQDYRPALYGGIAAVELGADGIRRVPACRWTPRTSSSASCSPTPASPATRASTTGRSPSATSTATAHVFDCFERIRDTAAAMREALAAGRLGGRRRARSPTEWDEPQAARPRRHHAGHRRADRPGACGRAPRPPRCAAPAAAAACSAWCRPRGRGGRARPWRPAGRALLDFRVERDGLKVDGGAAR